MKDVAWVHGTEIGSYLGANSSSIGMSDGRIVGCAGAVTSGRSLREARARRTRKGNAVILVGLERVELGRLLRVCDTQTCGNNAMSSCRLRDCRIERVNV